ncbi:RNA 2',3'-cyclic phosphodiesterase [Onishia niordana]|uniref:RNA 2',3'-cyclic phosphodiesterase n=1 Tax=Onishia niordana TaxID=2508711 RepID=UPI00109F02E5|nr:RNA 2',3'-cyclic phosphodiesterase [Halomonas niordiana]
MANQRRLFLALWPDPAMREELSRATDQAHRACGGHPVAPENFHLTLAFLGQVPDERLPTLLALTNAFSWPSGTITLDRVGYFQHTGMLWLGSQAPTPDLLGLYQRLWRSLADEGLSAPEREFLPHVTLLRHAAPPSPGILPSVSLSWHYNTLQLIESVTTAGGPRYTSLATSSGE